ARRAAEEAATTREAERAKAFEEWALQKSQVEAARQYLANIDTPQTVAGGPAFYNNSSSGGGGGGNNNSNRAMSVVAADAARAARAKADAHWLVVGRALKRVDARLLPGWTTWCKETHPVAHCQALWDSFAPRACDVHAAGHSAVREMFLRLLRPGIDYRAAFQRVLKRRRRGTGSSAVGGGGNDGNGGNDGDRDGFRETGSGGGGCGGDVGGGDFGDGVSLDGREMKLLLTKELGMSVTADELRRLVDAFDTDGDQRVSWKEFEDFTGGRRG
ncbi:unnamed protein product, partial [Phaeothamnion confervicola]